MLAHQEISQEILDAIGKEIQENPVILYMKGSSEAPQCGFSSVVCQVLKRLNVPFKSVNILLDPMVREGIKVYSNWPTIPQLYVKGEFIGGCDIVREMYETGELESLLKEKNVFNNLSPATQRNAL